MLIDELKVLTGLNSEDITQQIYELIKDKDRTLYSKFIPQITDIKLRGDIINAIERSVTGCGYEEHSPRFNLKELKAR